MSQAINLEDEAVSYAARGWLVFPAPPGQKKSYKSAEYSNGQRWGATRDADEIRRDFARWPDANIGIPTGPANKIFVVEADTKQGHGVDGIASLKQLETDYGPLPETLMAESPSGSVHYYFNCPKVGIVRNSASKIAPGIDVRGEGGMVIAPPSVREDGVYRWIHRNPIADAPEWLLRLVTTPAEAPQRELPDWLRDILAGKGHAGLGSSSDPADLPPPVDRKKIDDALAAIDPDIDRGPWFEIGCALYAALGDELGFKLWDLWSFGGKKYHGEDMIPQWRSIVEGNYAYTANTIFHYAGQAKQSSNFDKTIILTLEDWLGRDIEKADYICGNWMTTTSRVLFTADTGLGKTLWAIALGFACAAGLPFMHWPATRPIRVLYVDGEMSPRVMKERLADAVKRLGQKPQGMHLLNHEDLPDGEWYPLNTPAGQQLIEKIIAQIGGVDLIVFDNIMALIEGDQKDEEGWRKTMPWIRKLTRQKIAQIWIHHTGHDATRGYGTKTREWQMDTVVHGDKVERDDTDVSFKLTFKKARERAPDTRHQFSEVEVALVNDEWTWKPSSGIGQTKIEPLIRKFYDALCFATAAGSRQVRGSPAATIEEWRSKCVGSGLIDPQEKPDSARTLFNRAKRELIAANWIACNETEAWTLGPNSQVGPF